MALKVQSIYALWYLCSDLVYAILFPQLCCVIYVKDVNTYGSLLGYIVAVILRVGGGETLIKLDPFLKYPYYNEIDGQLFPFRTFAMLCSFFTIIWVSYAMKALFQNELLPRKCDVFKCVPSERDIHFSTTVPNPTDGVMLVDIKKVWRVQDSRNYDYYKCSIISSNSHVELNRKLFPVRIYISITEKRFPPDSQ